MFMNKTNRLAAITFVLSVASATATAAATDISGAWIVTLDMIQSKTTMEANIKQNEDKLEAEVGTPAGTLNFSGTLVDDKISAVYLVRIQGKALEIRMKGLVEGDTLSGTIEFAPGQELNWTAVRKPVDGAPAAVEAPAPAQDTPTEATPEAPK